jgi:hypothetical protein
MKSQREIDRYYLDRYKAASQSDELDGRLFATIDDQKNYFHGAAASAASKLRSSLYSEREKLIARLAKANAEERQDIELSVAGIDAELADIGVSR